MVLNLSYSRFFFLITLFILLFNHFGSDCLIVTILFVICFFAVLMICFVIFDVHMLVSLLLNVSLLVL